MKKTIYNPYTPQQIEWFKKNGVPIDTEAFDAAEEEEDE